MCAKLLSCPLCSQPAFLTLDALRTGLISVATRPLACPVCNEVLLGVDKLTIHLFSHAINLSNDGKQSVEQSRVAEGRHSFNESQEIVRKEHIVPVQTWNVISKETAVAKQQSFCQENNKFGVHTASKLAVTPLRKIASALDNPNATNSTTSTSLQNSLAERSQARAPPSLITNGQSIIFVQSSSGDTNDFECQLNHVKLEKRSNSTKDPEESFPKTILQFQPIWAENSEQEICVQNILVGASTGQAGQQILTIASKPAPGNEKHTLPTTGVTQKSIEVNNGTDSLENQTQSPDQSRVLPQLKAFKALATKEKTERCDICGFYFSDPNILTLHKQLVHMINEKDLNRKPEDLLKNYPCHLCPKVFKMRGSLMVHMRVAHTGYNLGSLPKEGDPLPIPGEHGYNCPTCGKNFKKEQHVTQHLKTHEGKQWECDVCSKMFTTKYFLKKHKRLHSGEMPYKCNICDKTFTFQQSYHKHRLYHKDDKPHACTTCGRSFKELSTLHNHERIHTGEKPFACETCGKCFRQRVSYLVHRRIHTGAMPYKCTACGKSFRYKVSQRTHKCTAQPPGTVVRQSSDLVQRLLQVSQIKESGGKESNEVGSSSQADCVPNEENRYILIVNNQGQHVLTRQSEVDDTTMGSRMEAERVSVSSKYEEGNDGTCIEDLWGHNIPTGTTLRDSMEMSVKNDSVEELESEGDGGRDFFSMVLSTRDNETQSPSTEMEHLRLSSPTSSENLLEIIKTDGAEVGSNFQCGISDSMIRNNFRNENRGIPLPTINEESLKQLLYGTESGQQLS